MQVICSYSRKDNIAYVLQSGNTVIIIDPYDVDSIFTTLCDANGIYSELEDAGLASLNILCLTTHYHLDHSKGNSVLAQRFPNTKIVAGSKKAFATYICKDKEIIKHDLFTIACIHTPCHTEDSFSYYITHEYSTQKAVFVGDTIFYLGCGKFFEGNAEMMQKAFEKIMSCPEDADIYYGHDYKEQNVQFRNAILQKNTFSSDKIFLTVKEEKTHNFYINTDLLKDLDEFRSLSSLERLALIRKKKDVYNLN